MNIIIACGGNGTRWNNYTGVEKQLVIIYNKPLLERTLEQIKTYLKYNKIYLLVNETNKFSFNTNAIINDCEVIILSNNSINNVPALYSMQNMLNSNNDILLLLGDVFFTNEAFIKIKENINNNYLNFFGRLNLKNKINHKCDELFAFYFSKNTHNLIKHIMHNVKELYNSKKIHRFLHWEILTYYYAFKDNDIVGTNEEIKKYKNTFENRDKTFIDSFILINDLTDDFDYPKDYDSFLNKINL